MIRRRLGHLLIGTTLVALPAGCSGGDDGPHLGDIVRLSPEDANYGVVATRSGHAVIAATPDSGPASISLRTRRGPGEWSTPEPVADPGFQVMSIAPGVDDSGRPTIAWVVRNLSTTASQISTRSADGAWPAPTSIPPAAASPFAALDLGVTGTGDAVVVWDPSAGRPGVPITGVVHTRDGSWERPRVLERATTERLQTGSVIVAQQEAATAVWMQTVAGKVFRSTLRAAAWEPRTGWRPTRTLPTIGRVLSLADARPLPGGMLIAWTTLTGGTQRLDLARLGRGGAFSRVGTISIGQGEQSEDIPQIATADDGSAAVLVPRWTGGDAQSELVLVRIGADGRVGSPQVLDRQAVPAAEGPSQRRRPRSWGADIALAEDGTATVAWLKRPATANPGQQTTTMAITTATPDGRVTSSDIVNDSEGAGVGRPRVDQIDADVVLVSWWRFGRNGRIAGTYGIEVSR